MTKVGDIPAFVLENAETRLAAGIRARTRPCCFCDQPATHWPCTGQAACEAHRSTQQLTPDPDRAMAALRRRFLDERVHLAEEQLLTVRIGYVWASEQKAVA